MHTRIFYISERMLASECTPRRTQSTNECSRVWLATKPTLNHRKYDHVSNATRQHHECTSNATREHKLAFKIIRPRRFDTAQHHCGHIRPLRTSPVRARRPAKTKKTNWASQKHESQKLANQTAMTTSEHTCSRSEDTTSEQICSRSVLRMMIANTCDDLIRHGC